jgi:SAM-dependent methyltransferase
MNRAVQGMSERVNPWDDIFEHQGRVFTEPQEDVPRIASLLKAKAAQTVLDLGCGSGRHVAYLARQGFSVFGVDQSPSAIALTQQWLNEEGLSATLRLHDFSDPLPFEDAFFDAVISTQVIHHATLATIKATVQEIERVLKHQGFLFLTVPSLRNQGTQYRQIEPNTLVPLDGMEKGLPHHYFTEEELREVFGSFNVRDIHLDARKHYCLSALKL